MTRPEITALETLNSILLGKPREVELALATFIARGSLLIEDRPGFGKTTLAKGLASVLALNFSRIQCTNDLLPMDILGRTAPDRDGNLQFFRGPIFAEVVLLDELNRAPARTQSAFLQAMEEGEITVDGITTALPSPGMFIATQNPSDHIGTTLLPESELDRFTASLSIGVPEPEIEKRILRQESIPAATPAATLGSERCVELQAKADQIHVSETFLDLVVRFLNHARKTGAMLSPRAGKDLLRLSRALALLRGRDHALPTDFKDALIPVISHRVPNSHEILESFSFLA
ncbi:MAG: MoxR family ATPase [Bdellovibrionales bacterium]|nr:MoxR family ATPase [Bdellovibrionales bacterium]